MIFEIIMKNSSLFMYETYDISYYYVYQFRYIVVDFTKY